jgi:hypothetical protein
MAIAKQVIRSVMNSFRSTPVWRDWVNRLAESERIGVPDLIDRALAEYARNHGSPDPPPKR